MHHWADRKIESSQCRDAGPHSGNQKRTRSSKRDDRLWLAFDDCSTRLGNRETLLSQPSRALCLNRDQSPRRPSYNFAMRCDMRLCLHITHLSHGNRTLHRLQASQSPLGRRRRPTRNLLLRPTESSRSSETFEPESTPSKIRGGYFSLLQENTAKYSVSWTKTNHWHDTLRAKYGTLAPVRV